MAVHHHLPRFRVAVLIRLTPHTQPTKHKMKNTDTQTQPAITKYEVIDHGVDHSQYFQGCGVSYTSFDHVATGCGSSASEAWNDALEQIASDGTDVQSLEDSEDGKLFTSAKAEAATVEAFVEKQGEEMAEDCELYYYVSIRYCKNA